MNPGLFDGDLVDAAWFSVEVTDGGQYDEELIGASTPPVATGPNLLPLLGVG